MFSYRTLLLLLFLYAACPGVHAQVSAAQQRDIDTLGSRFFRQYVSEKVDVKLVAGRLQQDGSWTDINYADSISLHSDFGRHTARMKQIAIAYNNPSNELYHSAELLGKLQLAFEFFYNKKWKSANWWYDDIGIPDDYMAALLLIKGAVKKETLLRYATFLKDATGNRAHQGMNRVWVSRITIVKGCIEDDYTLVEKGFLSAASTLAIAEPQGIEGIKKDWSFHQPRAQLYSGGYGLGFASDMADLQWLSTGTSFASLFTVAQKDIFSGLLLQGHQLLGYRNTMDFGTEGRNISRPGGLAGIRAETLEKMIAASEDKAPAFQQWLDHVKGKHFPAAFRGNRYFWRSAIMTQHGADWYLSAKVISTRTTGTEMLNEENLLGYNLPLGATNIMVTGGEYKDIFPVWDWSRVPGVTAVNNGAATRLTWYLFGNNEFAGGVSDGRNGVLAYTHSYNGIQAKKAYFFTNGYLVCMGAGITAMKTQQITTSLDQSIANGPVQYGYAGGASRTLKEGDSETFDTAAALWVYHNHTGYLLPAGGKGKIQQQVQTGSWKTINASVEAIPVSKNVFSLWLRHGEQPTGENYVYQVAPGVSQASFEQMVLRPDFTVVQNTDTLQAIRSGSMNAAVFYQGGIVDWGNGWKLYTDSPAMVLLTIRENHCSITVADPLYRRKSITIAVNKTIAQSSIRSKEGMSFLTIDLPQGPMQGSSVSIDCTFK
jgi:chondroitin AC lyase